MHENMTASVFHVHVLWSISWKFWYLLQLLPPTSKSLLALDHSRLSIYAVIYGHSKNYLLLWRPILYLQLLNMTQSVQIMNPHLRQMMVWMTLIILSPLPTLFLIHLTNLKCPHLTIRLKKQRLTQAVLPSVTRYWVKDQWNG